MITFSVEDWNDCKDDLYSLSPMHYNEIALDKDKVPLDPDFSTYQFYSDNGMLHIVVVRKDGAIIGYNIFIVRHHLHYKSTLCGFGDIFFIKPEERKGSIGIKLIKETERTLKQRGVKKLFTGVKKHYDISKVFEHLGWKASEVQFIKWIGE